jgi:hypothetical protein
MKFAIQFISNLIVIVLLAGCGSSSDTRSGDTGSGFSSGAGSSSDSSSHSGSGSGSGSGLSSSNDSEVAYPVKALHNIGETCYFNAGLHFIRKLEESFPTPVSPAHQLAVNEFAQLLRELSSPDLQRSVVSRDKIESFRTAWNNFKVSGRCLIVPRGDVHSIYECLRQDLGYEPITHFARDRAGNYRFASARSVKDRFVADGGPQVWDRHVIGEVIKIDGIDHRIIACEPYSNHKTALVEDSFMRDGIQETEFFHYDDTSITWVPKNSPRRDRACASSVMVLERVL